MGLTDGTMVVPEATGAAWTVIVTCATLVKPPLSVTRRPPDGRRRPA
jgi:hypothetical protein